MIWNIFLDDKKKAELPGNLNKDRAMDIFKIYLFNEEYQDWKEFKISRD